MNDKDEQYKIAISGELADRILESMPETAPYVKSRISSIIFVVRTDGDIQKREDAIDRGVSPDENDEEAYLLDIMTLDEGTFPDMKAVRVTNKPWSVFP